MERTALLSASDKTGIAEFARGLASLGFRIVSTGRTASHIREAGVKTMEVSTLTGFPEMFDGRVKTLHPIVHGGILARESDRAAAVQAGIGFIDVVAVNLYPFEKASETVGISEEALVEEIDVGGPTLLRAAAKNHSRVVVVADPADYPRVLELLQKGEVPVEARRELALKAFSHTARYDALIYRTLHDRWNPGAFPPFIALTYRKVQDLRYGENPHQRGALYHSFNAEPSSLSRARKVCGKELSFNNMLDADNALGIIREFEEPCACVVKHINPCGVGVGPDINTAWERAHKADPMSAYGGIVAINRPMTMEIAQAMDKIFLEMVLAPEISDDIMAFLTKKKNRRILLTGPLTMNKPTLDFKPISGGLLLQDKDIGRVQASDLRVVTKRAPTPEEIASMLFGARLLKRVRSNTILFTRADHTVGIGAGQMSRVDAVRIAGEKSKGQSPGCTMASDAFFPFRDGIDEAAKFGITAVIQPGGSIRDAEVVQAADEHGMAMVYSGMRAFWH